MAEEASTSKTKKRNLPVHQAAPEDQAQPKKPRLVGSGPEYKGEGLKLSFHGVLYQLHLLTLFLKRGLDLGYTFRLGSEVTAAEKFDDLVFRYKEDGTYKLRLFQAKHKRDENKKITRQDLVKTATLQGKSKNLDFSIQKYFTNYKKFKLMKETEDFLEGEIQNFTFYTNIDIDPSLEENFENQTVKDPLLSFDEKTGARSLKLICDTPLYNELVGILTSEYELLPEDLCTLIATENYNIKYNKKILDHKHWIMTNIFDRGSLETAGKKTKKYYLKFREELNEKFSGKFFEALTKRDIDTKNLFKEKIQIFPSFGKAIKSEKSLEENFHEIDVSNDLLLSFDEETRARSDTPLQNKRVGESSEYLSPEELGTLIGTSIATKNYKIKHHKKILDHNHWIMTNIFVRGSLETAGKKTKKYYLKFREELDEKFSGKFFEALTKRDIDTKNLFNEKIQISPSFAKAIQSKKNTDSETELNESKFSEDIHFFLDNLVFAVGQPTENQLKDMLETEMATKIKLPDGELALSIVRTRLQDWFKEKVGRFLTDTDCKNLFDDLENIVAFLCQKGITLTTENNISHNIEDNCSFKNDYYVVKTINDFLNNEDHDRRVLLVFYDVRLLTEIKVLQLRKQYKSNTCMWADIKDYVKGLNSVACPVKAFKSDACKRMFVMQSEITDEAKKLLKSIFEILKKEDKKLIIIMPLNQREEFIQKTRDVFNDNCEELKDLENSFENFSLETQYSLRRNAKLVFNGYTSSIEELLSYDDTMLQNLRGDVLSKLLCGRYEFAIDNTNNHYEKTKKYYIKRRLQSKPNEEGLDVERLNNIHDRLIVITGEPGSGKSSLLSHVATKTKELQLNNPLAEENMCIINVSLRNYNKQLCYQDEITDIEAVRFLYILSGLQAFDESKECSIVFEFNTGGDLAARMHSGQTPPLHIRLFQYLYDHNKIVLLLDGFDEIAPHYAERVLDYIIKFKDMRIEKIWVTSRPYDIRNNLTSKKKNVVDATPYTLMPLSKQEQKELLKVICKQKKSLKKNEPIDINDLQQFCTGKQFIDRTVTKTKTHDFLSTPQQLIMLAKIYNKERKNQDRKKITIYSLYEKCVDIYFKKVYGEIDLNDSRYRTVYEGIFRSSTKRHERIAFLELFSNLDIELPSELVPLTNPARLRAKVNKGEEKSGLIVSAADGKSAHFVHRTYAEFFAARGLADEAFEYLQVHDKKKNKKNDDPLLRHSTIVFLYKIMCSSTMSYLFLAFFNYRIIDRMLNKKQKGKSKRTAANTVFTTENADIFKAAIEGDVNILDSEKCVNLRDALGRTPIYLAMSSCSTADCKLLVEKYLENHSSILTKDRLFQWTALHYFMLFSHHNLSDIFSVDENDIEKKRGIDNLKSVNEDDFKDWDGQTPLMLALGKNEIDVRTLKFVIDVFINIVNAKDNLGKTAAHKVIANIDKYRANSTALTLLLEKANFYSTDKEGKTPLYILSTKKMNSVNIAAITRLIVFLFKENKSKIIENFFEKCVQNVNWCVFMLTIHPEVSRSMLNLMETNGLNVNLRDSEGKSALHRSIAVYQTKNEERFSIENYCYLLEKKADVRAPDNYGRYPTDYWTDDIFEKIRHHTEVSRKKRRLANIYFYGYQKLLEMKKEYKNKI